MATSARGRRLAARAKHLLLLQADLLQPLLSSIDSNNTHRRDHRLMNLNAAAASAAAEALTAGRRLDWHTRRLQVVVSHGAVVGGGDLPRVIVDHIRRCRGPPRLSVLDRFDAAGEGACLKRYTNPSFFRNDSAKLHQACTLTPNQCLKTMETRQAEFQSRDRSKPPDSPHTDCSYSGASEKASPGFLSMLRKLKHRQKSGSLSPGSMLQMQQRCIHKYFESSADAERRDSSAGHSETDTSFASSPQLHVEKDKAKENYQSASCYSDAASNYVGNCSELERTSSFEAWLSPGARFSSTHEYEATQESSHRTCNRFLSHAVAETPRKKGVSMRHRYRGSIEMIASRVSSLPRKLCMKHQHDPLSDSSRSLHADGLRSQAFLPLLVADPVFGRQDSVPQSEESYSHQENARLLMTGCPSYDDASVDDAEIHDQQNGPSISNQYSNSSSPENCGHPTYTPQDLLSPRMQRTGCMIDGSLHIKATSVLPENSCSEDTKVDTSPLLPIPPMQWLSVKVRTGPTTYRKPFGKYPVQRAVHSCEAWSEQPAGTIQQSGAEIHSQQEPRQQLGCEDSDKNMQILDRPTEKLTEERQVSQRKGPEVSSSRGNTVSDSETNKRSNAIQADVQNSAPGEGDASNLHDENVFFSAMEQLSRMPPPWVPRPKHPLPEIASHDRITLRNGPSPIHGSRSILDSRTALLEQIKDKSFSLKPVSGTSSPVSVTGSPTNARVATILQRADDMRQAHTDSNDVDGEDSWSDHSG